MHQVNTEAIVFTNKLLFRLYEQYALQLADTEGSEFWCPDSKRGCTTMDLVGFGRQNYYKVWFATAELSVGGAFRVFFFPAKTGTADKAPTLLLLVPCGIAGEVLRATAIRSHRPCAPAWTMQV